MKKKLRMALKEFLAKHPWIAYKVFWRLVDKYDEIRIFHKYWSDEKYISTVYKSRFDREIDLTHPRLFNDKNNWRKLYDRKPIYTSMVDKLKVKSIINERLGSGHCFALLGSWKKPANINISLLPDKFVLKCNHDGGVFICRDKSTFDIRLVKLQLSRKLHRDYFVRSREWPYKHVKRCIICEEYMGEGLTDYKVYCFNGEPRYAFVWKNTPRTDGSKPEATFCGAYDLDWVKDEKIRIDYPSLDENIPKPDCLNELWHCARVMAENTYFLRVDCYVINNHVYVGETTFFPWGGFMKFCFEETNIRLGEMERLPIDV